MNSINNLPKASFISEELAFLLNNSKNDTFRCISEIIYKSNPIIKKSTFLNKKISNKKDFYFDLKNISMMEIDSEAIFIILPFKHPLFKKLINTLNIDFKITQQKANLFIYFSKNDSTWHFSNQLIFVDKNNNFDTIYFYNKEKENNFLNIDIFKKTLIDLKENKSYFFLKGKKITYKIEQFWFFRGNKEENQYETNKIYKNIKTKEVIL